MLLLASLAGGKMSLRCAANGHVLVHRGSPPGGHWDAPDLPFSDNGNSSVQESVPSILSWNQFSLSQWSFDGLLYWGVGLASQNSPEGPQCCWCKTSMVREFDCVLKTKFPTVPKTIPCSVTIPLKRLGLSRFICFRRLILGMMLTTSFLSMWLSNTATTAMMLPIANAILESLFGNLESLKEKCKSPKDTDHDVIHGRLYLTCVVFCTTAHCSHTSRVVLTLCH